MLAGISGHCFKEKESLMQSLPVIIVIVLAAVAIIAVFLWRVKPAPLVDTDALNKRISEEAQKAQVLQGKLDAIQGELRDSAGKAAAAQATADAAKARAESADSRADQVKAQFDALQKKYNDAEPAIATAKANIEATEKAKSEVERRFSDLSAKYDTLQTSHEMASQRAANAEKDCAAARSEATALHQRVQASEDRLSGVTSNLDALHAEYANLKTSIAEANTQLKATEAARSGLEQSLAGLMRKYETLQSDYNTAAEQATASKKEAEHLRMQIGDVSRTLETSQLNLTEEKAKLNQALAKLQTDEAAANHFKNISKTILEETLDQARRSVEELAVTFQKSSGVELERHADKITRTLEPLQAQLVSYDKAVESLKKGTQENYGSLREQLSELQKVERSLHEQAKALTTALSASPKVKGSYGELILKQLVEFVGMQEKCHFETQASRETEEGRKIPDLVVAMPGGQKVLVDAKAVMDACVEAQMTQDDVQRAILLRKHCDNVRSRVVDLSSKNYYVDHQDAVEAVVLFLPAENLYATAMENDPGLTEFAMGKNIIICGPNSLMLLLKVSNQLWRRASIEKEVTDIRDCGEKIYKAACDFVGKFVDIGKRIQSLEAEYNGAVATLEGRLLPAGKRMSAFDSVSGKKEITEIEPIKDNVREFKEATRRLTLPTQKLPGLVVGDETAEFAFASGEIQ
jgi:DNA recombination protein RmuC